MNRERGTYRNLLALGLSINEQTFEPWGKTKDLGQPFTGHLTGNKYGVPRILGPGPGPDVRQRGDAHAGRGDHRNTVRKGVRHWALGFSLRKKICGIGEICGCFLS